MMGTWVGGCVARLVAVALCVVTMIVPALAGAAGGVAYAGEPCPNEALRVEDPYSLSLPDCRAYEQVSPVDKQGGAVAGLGYALAGVRKEPVVLSLPSGDGVTYMGSRSSTGNGAQPGNQYIATRTAEGWLVEDLSTAYNYGGYPAFVSFSADLASAVVESEGGGLLGVPGATPEGYSEIYLRETASGRYVPLNTTTPPDRGAMEEFHVALVGATPDLSHVVFIANDALTPATAYAPAAPDPTRPETEYDLYEWSGGVLRLVNVLPGNTATEPVANGVFGQGKDRAVWANGSRTRIFWASAKGHLYMREDGERTVAIDATGRASFLAANAEGSRVFFTDERALTEDSTAVAGAPDLYEYDVEGERLNDLTVARHEGEHGDVRGLLGSSEDGSYLYFVANGVLAAGASQGDCESKNEYGRECNLYVWHDGTTKFIARLSREDGSVTAVRDFTTGVPAGDWATQVGLRTAEVTPDGRHLAFMSVNSLTGYDNTDANGPDALNESTGGRDFEVFVYDYETGKAVCASCNPGGAPVGDSWLPVAGSNSNYGVRIYQPEWLSEDGTVFFDSRDVLSPADSGGAVNVYEFEHEGAGGCSEASEGFVPAGEGCLSLLSDGADPNGAYFDQATPSGSDVFFTTRARLVGQDEDEQTDLYDARVDGGIAVQNRAVHASCAGAEACRGPAGEAPSLGAPLSQVFSGPGNLAPPAGSGTSAPTPTPKRLTRVEKLKRALAACAKKRAGRRRAACERRARRRYGAHARAKKRRAKKRRARKSDRRGR